MTQMLKTGEQMQRHFKGVANHYRIEIILLISKHKDLTVNQIAESLRANFKTISQHTRYLVQAGLLQKRYLGNWVCHELSPYGKMFAKFIRDFQRVGSHAPK
ncbi:MAG: winged helix-turn-helix domain-containing protein [Candidatus Liptonbacteria bacterium]